MVDRTAQRLVIARKSFRHCGTPASLIAPTIFAFDDDVVLDAQAGGLFTGYYVTKKYKGFRCRTTPSVGLSHIMCKAFSWNFSANP